VTRAREPARTVVAIVSSAGGVVALGRVLASMPPDLPAAVIVMLHLLPEHRSHLTDILRRHTVLPVKQAADGDLLEEGWVYVAPPDAHLVVEQGGRLSLQATPPVRHLRPSGDVLLASLAASYGDRGLAIVLTGLGSDGAAGVQAVKGAGGSVFAQDEATSEYFGMPGAAIATGVVGRTLPLDEIASAVVDFLIVDEPA
jgi:two-component system chemotaxis response regulator CheB